MTIYIDGEQIVKNNRQDTKEHNEEILYINKTENREQILNEFDLNFMSKIKYENLCFESHKNFAYFYFLIPNEDLTTLASERIEVFYTNKKTMLLFYEDTSPIVDTIIETLLSKNEEINTLKDTLLYMLNLLNTQYVVRINEIDDKITNLEDTLVNEQKIDYISEISTLRKQLLTLRRYYEGMLTLMEDLEENRNGIFSEDALRLFHFQTQRAEHLYHNVLNLRDYLTQVREAYQALLDIEANKVMKLFTVITATLLPLNLLVGWYGMNLYMPEVASHFTYPIIIFISITIVVSLSTYFKRNRWF
ncbi:MAG: magnesium transporter [Ruminococcaceae bacterium]|nr:magnesium transporter [Oscillospiraceae bacterium]